VPANTWLTLAWIAHGSPTEKFSIELAAPPGFKVTMAGDKKNPIERQIASNLFVHTGSVRFQLEAAL
jgi:hypothetical protein